MSSEDQQNDANRREQQYQQVQQMLQKDAQMMAYKHSLKYTLETVGGEQNKSGFNLNIKFNF